MDRLLLLLLGILRSACRGRADLVLENVALRHQLGVLMRAGRRLLRRLHDHVPGPLHWFAIEHGRRRIVHFHVTDHPDAAWVAQQLREAFPFDTAPRHLVFDRDGTFSAHVVSMVKSLGAKPTGTTPRSPWQNGVAERWIGSVRRELLDYVVVFNDRHLLRLLREYVAYYHDDRIHLGLAKATPANRLPQTRPAGDAEVVALPRLGGLHHRYEWRAAA
jgi:putative transposase